MHNDTNYITMCDLYEMFDTFDYEQKCENLRTNL